MEEKDKFIEDITKSISKTVEDVLPEMVNDVVDSKVKEISEKTVGELDEIKEEMKKLNFAAKKADKAGQELFKKTLAVAIFKDVLNKSITSEEGFKSVVAANVKAMSEGEATEGAELVFEQFENDILKVINDYELVKDVRILPLAKGEKVTMPKATNGITTMYTDELEAYVKSKPVTAKVVINIAKTTTLTDMSEELLDDTMTIPDLYNLIVEFIGESQAEFLETQILTGTGSVKGILVNADVNVVALGAGNKAEDIDDTVLVNVMTTAMRKYKKNKAAVKRYTSQYVFGKIYAIKTTDGYPLYPELRGANPVLLGHNVVLSDVGFVQDASEDIDDGICMLFGDLKYYVLARRKGLTIERGYYGANRASDIQSLKSNTRVGGEATFPEAWTVIKNGAAAS